MELEGSKSLSRDGAVEGELDTGAVAVAVGVAAGVAVIMGALTLNPEEKLCRGLRGASAGLGPSKPAYQENRQDVQLIFDLTSLYWRLNRKH